jgi:monoamine oxidase
MLRLSAAAAGATALAPVFNWSALAEKLGPSKIAIIGGGVAGLTAAYRLQQHGAKPVLFEASNRWGGRMFTKYDFYQGMFCELGGELVDTNHKALRTLCNELGIEIEDLTTEGGEDLYFFKGGWHRPQDMLRPEKTGAYVPIAVKIHKDRCNLLDEEENWTKFARKLDRMSLKAYLKQFRGKAEDWAIDLLDLAYVNEYGLETRDQSCLNLVDIIGVNLSEPFKIFGESDEKYRIKGGSSKLIEALESALEGNKVEMKKNFALTTLDYKDGQIVAGFDAPGGVASSQSFDAMILALPFTKLRQVKGLRRLKLCKAKLDCIDELGMGSNSKIMNGTTSREWQNPAAVGLPAPSNSVFLTDLGFQCMWDTSRAQQQGRAGILTNFLGGRAAERDVETAKNKFRSGLRKMSPKIAESLDPNAVTFFFWNTYRFTLGSYMAAKPGQYTTILDVAAEPALNGRLQFAGEHTAADFSGFMNGGVCSGERAATDLIKALAWQTPLESELCSAGPPFEQSETCSADEPSSCDLK